MGLASKKEAEKTTKATFNEDLGPNESWLQGKINSAKEGGLNEFGVPKRMGSITGSFSRPLDLPTYLLSVLKGEQGEQSKVRKDSIDFIRKNWDKVKKEPIYVEVDPFGRAWVNEGNHRIMVARELGEKTLPVEVRYFSGGQKEAGPFKPNELIKLDEMSSKLKKGNVKGAGKAGLIAAALGGAGGASAAEIAESFLPLGMTPSTLAPGTLTPEQKAAADAATQRKFEEEAAARDKAQALLRSGVVQDETKMAKGGMMKPRIPGFQDGGNAVEPTTGNEVPIGSLPEEVADDIPAQLSAGEFVIPADVVRFIGLERLMKMRDEAKAGLQRMSEIGQMGNAEAVGEKADDSFEDDSQFESTIDGIMSEVDADEQTQQAFAQGGAVGGPAWLTGYDMKRAPKNPVFDVRYFKHSDGRMMYVTFYNGKPMTPIPDGFTETEGPVEQQVGKEAEEKTPSPAPAPSEGASAEDVGAQPTTTSSTTSMPGTFLGFTPMEVQKGAEMLGKVPTIATKALSFLGKNLSDNLAQQATAASMEAVQAEAEAQAPSSPASMGGMAASNAAVAAADASIAAGHSNAASIAAANAAASAINNGASPSEAATAGATAAAATDAGVSIGGQPGMEGISDVGGPSSNADAGFGTGEGFGNEDFGGFFAKGGMVQRRKQPAKKQKKKGLASR